MTTRFDFKAAAWQHECEIKEASCMMCCVQRKHLNLFFRFAGLLTR